MQLVFDAAFKYNRVSLNNALLKGPDFNNDLRGVLLRFREGRIGFVADIQKMFNNFKASEEHKDYLRFLWFADNNSREKIVQYRSNCHWFGWSNSPAVANFCLRCTARNLAEDSLVKQYIE